MAQALRIAGARLRGFSDDVSFVLDANTLRNGLAFTFTTELGTIDVLATPAGTKGLPDLRADAAEMDIAGMPVLVASLEDLIRMRTAAGRPKDRIEVESLAVRREELDGPSSGSWYLSLPACVTAAARRCRRRRDQSTPGVVPPPHRPCAALLPGASAVTCMHDRALPRCRRRPGPPRTLTAPEAT